MRVEEGVKLDDRDLLIRIDERVESIQRQIIEIKTHEQGCDKKYITKTDFRPVKIIAYSAVGMMSTITMTLIAIAIDRLTT